MKRWLVVLCVLLASGCAGTATTVPDSAEIPRDLGEDFGEVLLPAPESEATAAYLGLEGRNVPFRLAEVRARVVVVEVFDMYCVYCQRGAPRVNRFYWEIQREGLGDQIKVIGVGKKNSGIEVEVFRDTFEVAFPLFPDPEQTVTDALKAGKIGTPYFLILELNGGRSATVVGSRKGVFAEPQGFLQNIRNQMREKEE